MPAVFFLHLHIIIKRLWDVRVVELKMAAVVAQRDAKVTALAIRAVVIR